jgi:cysteine-rich repeat protein
LVFLATCDTEPVPACGDGVLAPGEACDDHNLADGDGCSSSCEIEVGGPALPLTCVDLLETSDATQDSMVVTPDGRVLVTGSIRSTASSPTRGWVGAFDQQGAQLWSLEFGEANSHVHRIRAKGAGFVFVHSHDTVWDVVEIDDAGNNLATLTLGEQDPGSAIPIDLLETPEGLLLGGASHHDLWLGFVSVDGSLETLALEDFAGLDDRIIELRRNGTSFAALAVVSVVDNSTGDSQKFNTLDTLLLEYDEQGNEKQRTHLTSGDEQISLSGAALLHGSDGTWFVAGSRWPMDAGPKPPNRGWVTAIHDGEIVWSREFDGMSVAGSEQVQLDFFDVVGTDALLLAGRLAVDGGTYQPYLARIAPGDGQLAAEFLGPKHADGSSIYWQADRTPDDRVWLLGSDRHEDRTVQWLCNTQP